MISNSLNTSDLQACVEAACRHAMAEAPRESCGLILCSPGSLRSGYTYHPMDNIAADPCKGFKMNMDMFGSLLAEKTVFAVVHSHPDGSNEPSESDIYAQAAMQLPWLIIPLNPQGEAQTPRWLDEDGSALFRTGEDHG